MSLLETRDWNGPRSTAAARDVARGQVLKIAGVAYGVSAFASMWVFWAYFIVFLANAPKMRAPWVVPSVDVASTLADPLAAAFIDLGLIALFGLQHSLMARPRFKRLWTTALPPALERATYVHAANIALFALVLFWQPIPIVLWHAEAELVRGALWGAFALGWMTLLAGAASFGLFDLLGVAQVWSWFKDRPAQALRLRTDGLYRWMKHPMYAGLLLGVWATPHMTAGHLLLAAGFTLYILIAVRYEQRDLVRSLGSAYQRWRTQ